MSENARERSRWLIIAAVVVAGSSLLCCGGLALAWVFGDAALETLQEIFAALGRLGF